MFNRTRSAARVQRVVPAGQWVERPLHAFLSEKEKFRQLPQGSLPEYNLLIYIPMESALPQKSRNGSAGADAGGAGVKEIFHFLFAVDAAGGFDFHLFSHVFFKEFHI